MFLKSCNPPLPLTSSHLVWGHTLPMAQSGGVPLSHPCPGQTVLASGLTWAQWALASVPLVFTCQWLTHVRVF